MLRDTALEKMMFEGCEEKHKAKKFLVTPNDTHLHTQTENINKYSFRFSILKCLEYNDQYLKEHLFLPQQLYCVIWRAALYLTS